MPFDLLFGSFPILTILANVAKISSFSPLCLYCHPKKSKKKKRLAWSITTRAAKNALLWCHRCYLSQKLRRPPFKQFERGQINQHEWRKLMSFVSKHNKFHNDGVAFWSIRYSNMQYSKMGGSPIVGHYRVEVHKYKCIAFSLYMYSR